jgi:hypothetical protein
MYGWFQMLCPRVYAIERERGTHTQRGKDTRTQKEGEPHVQRETERERAREGGRVECPTFGVVMFRAHRYQQHRAYCQPPPEVSSAAAPGILRWHGEPCGVRHGTGTPRSAHHPCLYLVVARPHHVRDARRNGLHSLEPLAPSSLVPECVPCKLWYCRRRVGASDA